MKVPKILHIGLCAGKNDGVAKYSSVSQALMSHCSKSYAEISSGASRLNEKVIQQAAKMKPDIIFCQIQAPDIIRNETIFELRKHCPFVVNWTGDVRAPVPKWYLETAGLFDVTFFTNMNDVRTLRNAGFVSEYLEIGYDPKIYYPDNRERKIDVAFLANNYGGYPLSDYRVQAAKTLRNYFGDRFKLYGGGWKDPVADGNLNGSQYQEAEFLRDVKIAINISHFNYDRYSSDRRLRILGSGCLCLSHNHRGIEEDFTDGVDLVTFDDHREMIVACDRILSEWNDFRQIAFRGHQKARTGFTFERMIDRLLNFYEKYHR